MGDRVSMEKASQDRVNSEVDTGVTFTCQITNPIGLVNSFAQLNENTCIVSTREGNRVSIAVRLDCDGRKYC